MRALGYALVQLCIGARQLGLVLLFQPFHAAHQGKQQPIQGAHYQHQNGGNAPHGLPDALCHLCHVLVQLEDGDHLTVCHYRDIARDKVYIGECFFIGAELVSVCQFASRNTCAGRQETGVVALVLPDLGCVGGKHRQSTQVVNLEFGDVRVVEEGADFLQQRKSRLPFAAGGIAHHRINVGSVDAAHYLREVLIAVLRQCLELLDLDAEHGVAKHHTPCQHEQQGKPPVMAIQRVTHAPQCASIAAFLHDTGLATASLVRELFPANA